MKKLLLTIIAVVMCLTVMATVLAAPQVTVIVNGQKLASDVPAQIINGRTMVPLRAIFEALGATVDWNDATKTVNSTKGSTSVSLTIGVSKITVNGTAKALDVAPVIIEGRTLVPARAIAEAYGANVGWDDPTKTVTITLAGSTPSTPAGSGNGNEFGFKGYIFDFDDNTSKQFHALNLKIENGSFKWSTEGTDPMMYVSYPKYAISMSADKYYGYAVRFKYSNLTAPDKAVNCQAYFKTDSDPIDSEAKSAIVNLVDCKVDSEGYTWAVFDFSDNFNWYGNVVGIRFDPVNKSGGSFEVEKIIMLEK